MFTIETILDIKLESSSMSPAEAEHYAEPLTSRTGGRTAALHKRTYRRSIVSQYRSDEQLCENYDRKSQF